MLARTCSTRTNSFLTSKAKYVECALRLKGWLAQLVEHLPYKQGVSGSIPLPPTIRETIKTER